MIEHIPGLDEWLTRVPEERGELGRPFRKDDPCVCSHPFDEHGMGEAGGECMKCIDDDEVCRRFTIDVDKLEQYGRAEAENLAVDSAKECL